MAEKRRGLGRGIGALIPDNQKETRNSPIDVFFNKPQNNTDLNAEVNAKTGTEKTEKVDNRHSVSSGRSEGRENNVLIKETVKKQLKNENAKNEAKREKSAENEDLLPVPGVTLGEILLEQIVPNTKQPRQIFDEEDLEELAASIKEVGVLQPIVVRPLEKPIANQPAARYELIMGERRWRASQLAQQQSIPAIVRRTEDEDLLRDALLENLHRAQLNALEEAAAYQQLLEDFQCTQEELSRRIARSRPQISNTLRLLKLPALVQRRVASGVLSAGHARALLGLPDPAAMERLAQRIVAEGLSVRATEELVALGEDGETQIKRKTRTKIVQPELAALATRLGERLETRVKVEMGKRKGKITIDFGSLEDLNRILESLDERGI